MYFDISPKISSQTAVFPGDQSFERKVSMSYQLGHHLELSSIETTVHIGAHADAPSHYSPKGETIEKRDLNFYIGETEVIEVQIPKGQRIRLKDFDIEKIHSKRVLFKTNSFPDPNHWNNDFNSLSPELIEALSHRGVILIGIDTPSIDPWDSKDLESHQTVYSHDLAILEGLDLSQVEPGEYRLVALPLSLEGADASPVRAVLFQSQDWVRL